MGDKMDWENDLSLAVLEIEILDDWRVAKPAVNEKSLSSSIPEKEAQRSFTAIADHPHYVLRGYQRKHQATGLTLLARVAELSKTPDTIVRKMETQNRDAAQSIIDCWLVESELRELFMNPDVPP